MDLEAVELALRASLHLRDLFARIAAHPQNRLDELLPDQWMAARMTASS
jgi:hypothetical protein